MPKIIITQKLPEPAKEGNWYQFGDIKIEYDPVELIDVLSIMDKLEAEYQNSDDRWWKLRAAMAGQKYSQQSVWQISLWVRIKKWFGAIANR